MLDVVIDDDVSHDDDDERERKDEADEGDVLKKDETENDASLFYRPIEGGVKNGIMHLREPRMT